MIDLYIYPLNQVAGVEEGNLPGCYYAKAPKKANRNRRNDFFIALFSPEEKQNIDAVFLLRTLQNLTDQYFSSSGPVTSGLKAAAEKMNEVLLSRNLNSSPANSHLVGTINLAVLHNGYLYIVHSGSTNTFLILQDGVKVFSDTFGGGRGLGVAKTLQLRYYQTKIESGDRVVLCAKPPEAWTASSLSAGGAQSGLSQLRRRLLNQAGPNIKAVVLQFKSGKGVIHLLRINTAASQPAGDEAVEAASEPEYTAEEVESKITSPTLAYSDEQSEMPESNLAETEEIVSETEPVIEKQVIESPKIKEKSYAEFPLFKAAYAPDQLEPDKKETPEAILPQLPLSKRSERAGTRSRSRSQTSPTDKPQKSFNELIHPIAIKLRNFFQRSSAINERTNQQIGESSKKLLGKVLPGQSDQTPTLSKSSMLFIAIAVPVIVVAIAMTVYTQRGKLEQRQVYIQEATNLAASAPAQTDSGLRKIMWQEVINYLDQADKYGETEESQTLRSSAQNALDQMDGIRRLTFYPTLSGSFIATVSITRIIALPTEDIYALDATNGNVIRMIATRPGYEVDTTFKCGPGQYGAKIVDKLIDIVPLNSNNIASAVILGMDQNGTVILCAPGESATVPEVPPPDNGWGKIQSISYENGNLYVLDVDPDRTALWTYSGNELAFGESPRLFFNDFVPENLANIIDITVYQEDIYLLDNQSRMLRCTYSYYENIPTRCTDYLPYSLSIDPNKPVISSTLDGEITQMVATRAPDPSLYLLDKSNNSIYHFSLALNLQKRMMPAVNKDFPLPEEAVTAFTITQGRIVHIAIGSHLYSAELP